MSGLKFSFDCGLRLLVNLKMLKEIAIRGKQIVTEEEAEWMENNLRSLETLQGFKHLVPLEAYSFHFPNLHDLAIVEPLRVRDGIKSRDSSLKILALNTSIVRLGLEGARDDLNLVDWNCILEYPKLEELSIGYLIEESDCKEVIWKIFEKLSLLHISRMELPTKSFLCDANFSRLRKLYIDSPPSLINRENLAIMIKKCTELEVLRCPIIPGPSSQKFAIEDDWIGIRSLTVSSDVEDMDLSLAVMGMHQAVSLTCTGPSFGMHTFHALQLHSSTITKLDIGFLKERRNDFVQRILCSAPLLQEIKADTVAAKDIANGHPWVCLLLRQFVVRIEFEEREDHLQPKVFMQISRLTKLCYLRVGDHVMYNRGHGGPFNGLKFSLENGLQLLENLKMLAMIDINGAKNPIQKKEVKWMEDNLVSLVMIKRFRNVPEELRRNRKRIIFYP
ncbi:hypothetical protein BGZ76_000995 [Entomortierella beljakovae]|nr:hypothetical protein BGZ76_000995 [Entomortierella beljakovae]